MTGKGGRTSTKCKLEVASWKLEAGSWKLEVGSWRLQIGTCKLQAGSWTLEAGGWKLEAADWKLHSGSCKLEAASWTWTWTRKGNDQKQVHDQDACLGCIPVTIGRLFNRNSDCLLVAPCPGTLPSCCLLVLGLLGSNSARLDPCQASEYSLYRHS